MRKLLIAVRSQVELYHLPSWLPQQVQSRFPELAVVALDGYEGMKQELPDSEIYVGWSLPAKHLARAKNLKWMHSLMTGVGQLCYPEMVASPIILTNAATVHAAPVAEHAWALILASARRLPSTVFFQAKKEWAQQQIWDTQPRPFEVSGLTLGLIGLGAIGREISRRARAFGMRVIAVKRQPERGREWADEIFGANDLPRLLGQTDVLVVAAPATPQTRHLLGEKEFALMKPSALLINVSRGSVVDEEALCRALREGRLKGAALDVTEEEPLSPDSPLWDAPNLLLTPHLASATERLWSRHLALLTENVRRYLAGEPLLNAVDKAAGY